MLIWYFSNNLDIYVGKLPEQLFSVQFIENILEDMASIEVKQAMSRKWSSFMVLNTFLSNGLEEGRRVVL